MTELITLKGRCGKELQGKLWKQGGTAKCPGHWSFNTYPRPSVLDLQRDVWRSCEGCESIKNGGGGTE